MKWYSIHWIYDQVVSDQRKHWIVTREMPTGSLQFFGFRGVIGDPGRWKLGRWGPRPETKWCNPSTGSVGSASVESSLQRQPLHQHRQNQGEISWLSSDSSSDSLAYRFHNRFATSLECLPRRWIFDNPPEMDDLKFRMFYNLLKFALKSKSLSFHMFSQFSVHINNDHLWSNTQISAMSLNTTVSQVQEPSTKVLGVLKADEWLVGLWFTVW